MDETQFMSPASQDNETPTDINDTHTVSYQVCTGQYRGPLDELLSAARGKDLPLSEVNVSHLIEDFASHIEDRNSVDVNPISSYLLLFSELLRIKTRSLLPCEEQNEEPEREQPDHESKGFFQQAADLLWDRAELRSRLYETRPDLPESVTSGHTKHREVTLFELIKAFKDIQETHRESDFEPSLTITNEYNTADRKEYITSILDGSDPVPFEKLLENHPTREEIIVTFLAILQLVKQNDLRIVKEVGEEQIYIITPGEKPGE